MDDEESKIRRDTEIVLTQIENKMKWIRSLVEDKSSPCLMTDLPITDMITLGHLFALSAQIKDVKQKSKSKKRT